MYKQLAFDYSTKCTQCQRGIKRRMLRQSELEASQKEIGVVGKNNHKHTYLRQHKIASYSLMK